MDPSTAAQGDFKLTLASLRIVSESLKSDVPKIMQDTQKAAQQGTELFTQLNKRDANLWQSLENLDQFTRTRAIRRSIIEEGQDDARPDFGRSDHNGG